MCQSVMDYGGISILCLSAICTLYAGRSHIPVTVERIRQVPNRMNIFLKADIGISDLLHSLVLGILNQLEGTELNSGWRQQPDLHQHLSFYVINKCKKAAFCLIFVGSEVCVCSRVKSLQRPMHRGQGGYLLDIDVYWIQCVFFLHMDAREHTVCAFYVSVHQY